jgi:CheY-like chemotaxis protein
MQLMEAPDLSQIRVLVADDEPKLRALVANALRALGCMVVEAGDGMEAWQQARGRRLDVVVLDVMMPGMSGWDVCRRIKTDPACADPPKGPPKVLMLTGIGEQLNELTSPLFAADAWIDKPFSLRALAVKVAELAGMDASAPSSLPPDLLPDDPIDSAPAPAPAQAPAPAIEPGPSVKKAARAPAELEEELGARARKEKQEAPRRAKPVPRRAGPKVKTAGKKKQKAPRKVKPASRRPGAKVKTAAKKTKVPRRAKPGAKRAVVKGNPRQRRAAPKGKPVRAKRKAAAKAKARPGRRGALRPR